MTFLCIKVSVCLLIFSVYLYKFCLIQTLSFDINVDYTVVLVVLWHLGHLKIFGLIDLLIEKKITDMWNIEIIRNNHDLIMFEFEPVDSQPICRRAACKVPLLFIMSRLICEHIGALEWRSWMEMHHIKMAYFIMFYYLMCLQCFDTVGWALGRASGL